MTIVDLLDQLGLRVYGHVSKPWEWSRENSIAASGKGGRAFAYKSDTRNFRIGLQAAAHRAGRDCAQAGRARDCWNSIIAKGVPYSTALQAAVTTADGGLERRDDRVGA
jgi:hypothetical protein